MVVGAEHGRAVAVDEAEVVGVHLERHEVELDVHSSQVGVQNAGVTGKHHGIVPCTTLHFVAHGAAGDDGAGDGAAEDPGDGRTEHIRSRAGTAGSTNVAGHVDVADLDGRDFGHGGGVPLGQACGPDDIVGRHAAEVLIVHPHRFERFHRPAALPPLGFGNEGQFVLADERTRGARGSSASADHFRFPADEDEAIDRLTDDGRGTGRFGRRIQRPGDVGSGRRRRHDLCGRQGGAEQNGGSEEKPRTQSFQDGHRDILAL